MSRLSRRALMAGTILPALACLPARAALYQDPAATGKLRPGLRQGVGGNPLTALTLTAAILNARAPAGSIVGALRGRTKGSTLAITDSLGGAVALSSQDVVIGPSAPSTPTPFTATVTETLGVYTRSTTFNLLGGVQPIAADAFGGTAGAALESRATPTGAKAWTSSSAGAFTLDGSGGLRSTNNANMDLATFDVGAVDYTVTATLSSYVNGSVVSLANLIFRYQNATNFWGVQVDPRNSRVTLYNRNSTFGSNNFDQINFAQVFTATNSTDQIKVAVRNQGSNITLYVNGVEIATVVDTFLQGQTRVGVYVGASGSPGANVSTWHDLVVDTPMGPIINWPVFTSTSTTTPQIPLGASGSYDDTDANNPTVMYDAANNRWALTYSGYHDDGSHSGKQNLCMAYASSIDGPWTKDGANPVQVAGAGEGKYAFNGGIVWSPTLGLWVQAYCYNNASQIAVATSPDFHTWTFRGVVIDKVGWKSGGAFDPFLRALPDGTFEMWFCAVATGGTAQRMFGRATSPDGLTWTEDTRNPIYNPGSYGAGSLLEQGGIGEPSAITPSADATGSQILLMFDGVPHQSATGTPAANRALHQAFSYDFGATWHTRLGAYKSAGGTGFESKQVFDSSPLDIGDGTLRLWHTASNVSGLALNLNCQIGEAKAAWTGASLI